MHSGLRRLLSAYCSTAVVSLICAIERIPFRNLANTSGLVLITRDATDVLISHMAMCCAPPRTSAQALVAIQDTLPALSAAIRQSVLADGLQEPIAPSLENVWPNAVHPLCCSLRNFCVQFMMARLPNVHEFLWGRLQCDARCLEPNQLSLTGSWCPMGRNPHTHWPSVVGLGQ
jgi:hypothetical protein